MMKKYLDCLVFAPKYNTGKKKDATGAFIPEAEKFMKFHDVPKENLYLIDNNKPFLERKKEVLHILSEESAIDSYSGVMFFCHGWKTGIQFGFNKTKSDMNVLAKELHSMSVSSDMVVGLYCCSTGRDHDRDKKDDLMHFGGDGGFADELRDALCRSGDIYCRVLAHTTPGHTTQNPNVREFKGRGRQLGGEGGNYIIPRKNWTAFKTWTKMLKEGNFRFEVPFIDTDVIQEMVVTKMNKAKKDTKAKKK